MMITIMVAVMVAIMVMVMIAVTILIVTMALMRVTRLDDGMGCREMDENLGGRRIIQHGGVEDAGVEEIGILHAGCFANRESVCGLFGSEVGGIERLGGNAELDGRLLVEQRIPGKHEPASGVGMVEIAEEYRRSERDSVGGEEIQTGSEWVAE
jgi:hypothetical protein